MKTKPGFFALNIVQSLGAANDNILKQVLIFGMAAGGLWADQVGEGAQAYASLCLALPFVCFSGFAGQFSDRFSKSLVIAATKYAEVGIALLAFYGLMTTNLWVVLAAMVMISLQSTFFSPAKFGILPEMVSPERLSRANGTMNMFTYSAVIFGGALGGPLYDAYAPDAIKFPNAEPMLWLPGAIILLVAIVGALGTVGLPKVPAQNPKYRIRATIIRPYLETWREIRGTTLAQVIIAWCWYYFVVCGIAILILPDYKDLLGISASWTAALMAILGISIGIGDFVAGRVSGMEIRPDLIPIGAIGTMVSFLVLGLIPNEFWMIAVCLGVIGFLGGFYIVPLQTMTQQLATDEQRGRVLGLWNSASFLSIIAGNLVFLGVKQTGIPSNRVFLVCTVLCGVIVVFYYWRWRSLFAAAAEAAKRAD